MSILDIFNAVPELLTYRCSSYNDYENHIYDNHKDNRCEEWDLRYRDEKRNWIYTHLHPEIKSKSSVYYAKDACIQKAIQLGHRFVGIWGTGCYSSKTCNKMAGGATFSWDISTCLGNGKSTDSGVK